MQTESLSQMCQACRIGPPAWQTCQLGLPAWPPSAPGPASSPVARPAIISTRNKLVEGVGADRESQSDVPGLPACPTSLPDLLPWPPSLPRLPAGPASLPCLPAGPANWSRWVHKETGELHTRSISCSATLCACIWKGRARPASWACHLVLPARRLPGLPSSQPKHLVEGVGADRESQSDMPGLPAWPTSLPDLPAVPASFASQCHLVLPARRLQGLPSSQPKQMFCGWVRTEMV